MLQILLLGIMLIAARPLQDGRLAVLPSTKRARVNVHRISNVEQLNQRLTSSAGNLTMLDLYADWCVACQEFEKYTFSDPQVQAAFGHMQLLQADVTANNASDAPC